MTDAAETIRRRALEVDARNERSGADAAKRYRDRKRGGPPRQLQPCGTRAAAERHRRHGEPLCEPCAEAEREYLRRYRSSRSPRRSS